ncbi:MAG: hypothetical protein WC233_01165 [Sphaerochaeta sp.]
MDIRRLRIWESRNATIMTNDLIQVVIEDQGGMTLELSTLTPQGGMVNAHLIPSYRGTGTSVHSDDNNLFWQNSAYLYQKAGSYFSFPNFGPEMVEEGQPQEQSGYTASSYWMVDRYGTDPEYGGVWLLSSIRDKRHGWRAQKIDMLLPGHPVHYSAIFITNESIKTITANAVWNNEIGSPFLEAGCVINASADSWITGPPSIFNNRLAEDAVFNDLKKAPLKGGGTVDLSEIPQPIGRTDIITGRISKKAELGYSSIINPRMQMIYLTFFAGPQHQGEDSIPMNFNSFLFDFGGKNTTPWSLYEGGISQQYSINCASGTHNLYRGLEKPDQLLDTDTTFTLEPGQTKHLFYGTAFAPYDNARIGGNFFSAEQHEQGIVLKRTKSTATISADSNFEALKGLAKRVLHTD